MSRKVRFTRLSKFIAIAWRSSHFKAYFYTRIILLSRQLRLLFVSALWTSSDVLVAVRLRFLSSFQFLMKRIFCIGFLHHYVDLTDLDLVWLASEMHAKEKYSLKSQGNQNIFCFITSWGDFRSSDYRLLADYRCIGVY